MQGKIEGKGKKGFKMRKKEIKKRRGRPRSHFLWCSLSNEAVN